MGIYSYNTDMDDMTTVLKKTVERLTFQDLLSVAAELRGYGTAKNDLDFAHTLSIWAKEQS